MNRRDFLKGLGVLAGAVVTPLGSGNDEVILENAYVPLGADTSAFRASVPPPYGEDYLYVSVVVNGEQGWLKLE